MVIAAIMDTYRLTHVPESYTAEHIRALFPIEDQSLIIGPISLAASVYADGTKTKVATVSFKATPECVLQHLKALEAKKYKATSNTPPTRDATQAPIPSKRQEFDWLLRDAVNIDDDEAGMVRIDNRLEGLTPLNELYYDDTTVE